MRSFLTASLLVSSPRGELVACIEEMGAGVARGWRGLCVNPVPVSMAFVMLTGYWVL